MEVEGRKGFAGPRVEVLCDTVIEARHEVSVHVQSRRDRDVTQTVLDGLRVCAGSVVTSLLLVALADSGIGEHPSSELGKQ